MDESLVNKCHLWLLFDDVVAEIFFIILVWLSPGWKQCSVYGAYLISRGINFIKPNKIQKAQLQSKSPKDEWDITFMFVLIKLHWNEVDKDPSKWPEQVGQNLESALKDLKDARNDLAHARKIGGKKRVEIMTKVRGLTERIQEGLKLVRQHLISSIQESEIVNKFQDFLDKIDDITNTKLGQETFDRYAEKLNLQKKMDIIEEHLPQLKTHLKKFTVFSPVTQLLQPFSDCQVEVQDVFTDMILEGESGNYKIELENLLHHLPHDDPERLLLIKGHAGVGKSTIVRKLISNWLNKTGDIKGLESFHMVFHVECREYIDSLRNLLVTALGDVYKSLNDNEFITATLAFKCLIIVDGFDEVNSRSSKLIRDILDWKKRSHELSIIFTTRPEAETKFVNQVITDFKTTIIRLEGIPKERFEDFVTKYHTNIRGQTSQPVTGLLEYLEKTKHKMVDTWKSPYNLSILTIIWALTNDVSTITTEAELHMKIFDLQKSKLEWRLNNDESVQAHLSVLQNRLGTFFWHLSCQALNGLKNDAIILSQSTYDELANVSNQIALPAEQTLGAFLRQVPTKENDKHYSFPHKQTQEFFAAYHVILKLTGKSEDPLEMEKQIELMIQSKMPENKRLLLLSALKSHAENKVTLRDIFKELHPEEESLPLAKYQNLLITIISIAQLSDISLPEELLVEGLALLRESGLRDKDSWIRVLKNLKFNDIVANWIANEYRLLEGEIKVNDFSFDAYAKLLKALKKPVGKENNFLMDIQLAEIPSGFLELTRSINDHGIQVRMGGPIFKEIFLGTKRLSDSQENSLNLLLQNCEECSGIWNKTLHVHWDMYWIRVRLQEESWDEVLDSLTSALKLKRLDISFGADITPAIRKIPEVPWNFEVFVTELETEEEAENVGHILRGFSRAITCLSFPRCHLKSVEKIIDSITGVRVTGSIYLPGQLCPDDLEKDSELKKKARDATGCLGIGWEDDETIWYW